MSELNGKTELPHVKLVWDSAKQAVDLEFNPAEFQNWDFVMAILDMAKQKVEYAKKMTQAQAMQQAQNQAIRDRAIRGKLQLP